MWVGMYFVNFVESHLGNGTVLLLFLFMWNVGPTPGAEPGHSCSFYSVLVLQPRCRTVGVQGVVVEDSLGTAEVSGVQVLFASLPSLSQVTSLVTACSPGLPSVLFVCSLNYS